MVWQNAFTVTTRMGSAKGRSKPMGLAAWVAIGFASGFAFGACCHRVDACGEQGKCFYYPQVDPLDENPIFELTPLIRYRTAPGYRPGPTHRRR